MKEHRRIWRAVLLLYLLWLVIFLVVKFNGSVSDLASRMAAARAIRAMEPGYNVNLIPFASIRLQVRALPARWAVRNLVANVAGFVPFGALLPLSFRPLRHWWASLGVIALAVAAVEVVQYVTLLGSCDIDDLILNLAGSAVGYLLFALCKR